LQLLLYCRGCQVAAAAAAAALAIQMYWAHQAAAGAAAVLEDQVQQVLQLAGPVSPSLLVLLNHFSQLQAAGSAAEFGL
jgi:type IV secretory pathway VirB2 component (pilin)